MIRGSTARNETLTSVELGWANGFFGFVLIPFLFLKFCVDVVFIKVDLIEVNSALTTESLANFVFKNILDLGHRHGWFNCKL